MSRASLIYIFSYYPTTNKALELLNTRWFTNYANPLRVFPDKPAKNYF